MRQGITAVLALVAGLLAGAVLAAPRPGDEALWKELQAILNSRAAALQRGDVEAWTKSWAPGYVMDQVDGTRLDRRQAEAALRRSLATLATVKKVTLSIERLERRGSDVVLMVKHGISGVAPARGGGSPRSVWSAGTAEQTWTRGPDGWILRRVKQRTNKSTL
jgi:hypothetical protein